MKINDVGTKFSGEWFKGKLNVESDVDPNLTTIMSVILDGYVYEKTFRFVVISELQFIVS